jgi:hypothetical protein
MADLCRILLCSDANKQAVADLLAEQPGGGIANLSIELTDQPSAQPPATWWGGSGWYPEEMVYALEARPDLCEVTESDGEASTFFAPIAQHDPVLKRVVYPDF